MRLKDDTPRILEALRHVEGVTVTTSWPGAPAGEPTVLVTLAGDRGTDRRDDREYLTEMEYYVRVFAAKAAGMRRVCAAVHEAMEALGYERVFRWEESGDGFRQTALRYRTYV